jgi:hypothetical protein
MPERLADTLTLAQLKRFVRLRNKSLLQTNLQFGIDAQSCGLRVSVLGAAQSVMICGFEGFQWQVPTADAGVVRLVEFCGALRTEGEPEGEEIFELLRRETACRGRDMSRKAAIPDKRDAAGLS